MKLAYRESGSGEPLVFLHSGLETSSTDFIYQQKYFSQFYPKGACHHLPSVSKRCLSPIGIVLSINKIK